MKIGIDLDGTALAEPKLWGDIMFGLRKQGHIVGIVTAHGAERREEDLALLDKQGFPTPDFYQGMRPHDDPELSHAAWKAHIAQQIGLDYLFDDLDSGTPMLLCAESDFEPQERS